MFDDAKNLKLLEDFEVHWIENSKEVENTELSKADVKMWGNNFNLGKNRLIQSLNTNYYTNEVETRINRVKNKFDISVLKAKANYRENERIRLKEAYGLIWPIIYFIYKIFDK